LIILAFSIDKILLAILNLETIPLDIGILGVYLGIRKAPSGLYDNFLY
jgi:hypothetical protein